MHTAGRGNRVGICTYNNQNDNGYIDIEFDYQITNTKNIAPSFISSNRILPEFPPYVLVWRNAWDNAEENFGPAPEKSCAKDFRQFYKSPKTLFVKDLK
jgi:hypothetical protein